MGSGSAPWKEIRIALLGIDPTKRCVISNKRLLGLEARKKKAKEKRWPRGTSPWGTSPCFLGPILSCHKLLDIP